MVVFPLLSALISLGCAGVIARDAVLRPRPDKVAWTIAFAVFTLAAATEVAGSLGHWTPALARLYYLSGAVLVVGYLALGELYLLFAPKIHRFAPGLTLLITAASATIVLNAPVDRARLAVDGWEAIERGPALTGIAIAINSLGTLVLVGGLGYSAWRFRKLGIQRHRMLGCLLIAVGTIVVGLGGTMTRLGHREYLYIPMAIGVAVIFLGYLQTRAPGTVAAKPAPSADTPAPAVAPPVPVTAGSNGAARATDAVAHTANGRHPVPTAPQAAFDPGIAVIEARLGALAEAVLAAFCREWSAEPRVIDALDRATARRAWALRSRLSPEGQARFDALAVATRGQLAELYFEVMLAADAELAAGRW